MKNAQGPAQWRAINWEKGVFRRITSGMKFTKILSKIPVKN